MNQRITQNVKMEIKRIVNEYGYWSKEFRDFTSKFEYHQATQICKYGLCFEKYGYIA